MVGPHGGQEAARDEAASSGDFASKLRSLPPMPTTERLVLRSWRAERRALRRHPGALGAARLRPVVRRRARRPRRVPGLRRAGRPLVPALGAPGSRGGLAPRAGRVGTRPRDGGSASVCAPWLRGARSRGRHLDHRPGQRALDPRRREARHAPRGRAHPSPDPPPAARLRDFRAGCGFFTTASLTPATPLTYVRSRRGTEPQRARPWGCEARRSEVTALLREPTWRRAPRAARDRVAFVKAHWSP
jgi:hypothetical protein